MAAMLTPRERMKRMGLLPMDPGVLHIQAVPGDEDDPGTVACGEPGARRKSDPFRRKSSRIACVSTTHPGRELTSPV